LEMGFPVTIGGDEFSGTVHGTSTCEQHYFVSAPAKVFGCNFATEGEK
jgi:hypothetical protein